MQSLNLDTLTNHRLRQDILKMAISHQETREWVRRIRAAMRPGGDECLVIEYEQMEPLNQCPTYREISEALVRLSTKDGLIMPGQFLPAIQSNTRLAKGLDRWVLVEVMTGLKDPNQLITVNLTAASVMDRDLPNFLACLMSLSAVSPQQLIFEITEQQSFDLAIAREVLGGLVSMGCGIALDDFAQGESGLHLLSLPLHFIKIDGSIIRLIHQPEYQEIAQDVMLLAKRRGLKVVAEWIESPEQEEIIQNIARSVGVEAWGQGYLYR